MFTVNGFHSLSLSTSNVSFFNLLNQPRQCPSISLFRKQRLGVCFTVHMDGLRVSYNQEELSI